MRIAERLRADLGGLLRALPEQAQAASGLSRYLDVVRPTCQRIVQTLAEPAATPETLVSLPGVRGLEQFLEAVRGHGVPQQAIEIAAAAVRQFEAFLDQIGGSQAKLAARLTTSRARPEAGSLEAEAERAGLFEAAARVTGRRIDTAVSLHVFQPAADDDSMLERMLAHGVIGSRIRPGGMPMVLCSGNTLTLEQPDGPARLLDDAPAAGKTQSAILAPFTTRPLPTVTSRGSKGKLVQVIDPDSLSGEIELDIMLGERSRHPMYDESGATTFDEIWTLVNAPTRQLIFDVYVEERLERRFRPSVDAQMWYPNLSSPGDDRWITRFPSQPRLQLLGRGISQAASPAYSRHAALTAFFFERLGLDPNRFVGFRSEVAYPIWRAGYRMAFEAVEG
ncbi:MAG: hypothetical protein IPJ41_05120 [Phycisphaerales bacterium]|nr:hypothetical protein [Phycisphaerales bacterium]